MTCGTLWGSQFDSPRKPDKAFIENYESIVPDIVELANYNIGLQEATFSAPHFSCTSWVKVMNVRHLP